MNDHPCITADPKVMTGVPCIKGTRVTVANIVRQIAVGRTPWWDLWRLSLPHFGISPGRSWICCWMFPHRKPTSSHRESDHCSQNV